MAEVLQACRPVKVAMITQSKMLAVHSAGGAAAIRRSSRSRFRSGGSPLSIRIIESLSPAR
ncbi:MAG: hypothetical protein CME15_03975 [Gemmatimonadetes bacterium]|nr:hypothetical protein [Gemmatimonadota bacterium]